MLFAFVAFSFAWVDQMLAVAAQIAMNELGDDFSDNLTETFKVATDDFSRPAQAAAWLYYVERPPFNLATFQHWHFHAIPYVKDGLSVRARYNSDDLSYGINGTSSVLPILQKKWAKTPWTFSFDVKLAFTLICDTLSALHNTELFSLDFPDGDRSGREFRVQFNGKSISLYDLWESGCGAFENNLTWDRSDWRKIDDLAEELAEEYPRNGYSYTPVDVMAASHEYDMSFVYSISPNSAVSSDYINTCRKHSREMVAKAGWAIVSAFKDIPLIDVSEYAESTSIRTSEIFSWVFMGLLAPGAACLIWMKHVGFKK